ncbi:HAD-IIB family hydrolase [Halomonas huangheensis]|uniref:Sucrose phosphatase-like domain-containing protein n=1 Tax=Halomonas huangheensis TaxID=1178482 RepID=W1N3K4_9GAMM|nr:HAD-IIB family hydrolase [Halomonas huangheensis]ALM51655.1 mannosyl-3-phosphoglycerate phosphatase [Halomonas huangheensis]ERL50142.1 hypothetical protein BJB45_03180 [Halomonas huangheensis]
MSSLPDVRLRESAGPRLVFTDLDGSLLDHDSYDWSPAQPWLRALKASGALVIPVTSKTRSELMALRQALDLGDSPFIAENGALVALPPAWCHARRDTSPGPDGLVLRNLGIDVGLIRRRVIIWRERLGVRCRTMSEMSLDEVMDITGLGEQEARLARLREGSEPLIWQDTEGCFEAFRAGLAGDGLRMTRGGRFWHVTGDTDKGLAVDWLVRRFRDLRGVVPHTLALGDGPNDVSMLETVDSAVVIRSRHGLVVAPRARQLYRTEANGPHGWAEGIAHFWGVSAHASQTPQPGQERKA